MSHTGEKYCKYLQYEYNTYNMQYPENIKDFCKLIIKKIVAKNKKTDLGS